MTTTSRYWYSISYREAGYRAAAYGTSLLSESELIAELEAGKYLFLDNLIYWEYGKAKSMKEWSKTDYDRIYINPTMVVSVTPLVDDPRKIIRSVDDLPPPRGLKSHFRRWLHRQIEKLQEK